MSLHDIKHQSKFIKDIKFINHSPYHKRELNKSTHKLDRQKSLSFQNLNHQTSFSPIDNSSGFKSSSFQLQDSSNSDMIRDPSFDNFQIIDQKFEDIELDQRKMHHGYREKARPASAKDIYFEDMMDTRNRPNAPFQSINDRFQPQNSCSDRYPHQTFNRQAHFIPQKETVGQPTTRRAHSYFNLETQGLPEPVMPPEPMLDSTQMGRFDPILGVPTLEYPSFLNEASTNIDYVTLQRECFRLNNELEISREKLNACMNSIKTFWSPELKRERTMRKEESSKYSIIADHLHQLQLEKQNMIETIHGLENEVNTLKDSKTGEGMDNGSSSEMELLKRRVDELTRENRQYIKEIEDADRKLNNLKSSLTASEESLANLIEAVKSNSKNQTDGSEALLRIDRLQSDKNEIERLRNQLNEAMQKSCDSERSLVDKDIDLKNAQDELIILQDKIKLLKQDNDNLRQDVRQTQTLQALVNTKASKILTLENEIRILEDEICRLRDDGVITPTTSLSSGIDDFDKTLHNMKSNERLFKSKIEMLNAELSKRDSEIYACQSRLEMLEKQQQDQKHHIDVLKEQVKTREHKISMLTSDCDDLRKRLKEKDTMIEKKTKSMLAQQNAKRQVETELNEVKEQLEIRDRKISLQKRKIENLEDLLNEKESQLMATRSRLNQMTLEKPIAEMKLAKTEQDAESEQLLEKMKETKHRYELELNDELEIHRKQIGDLRDRLDSSQNELNEKVGQLQECRDELSELRIVKFKQETEISQLKGQLSQKQSEINAMNIEKQMLYKQVMNESELKFTQRINELEQKVNHYLESASKLQQEVDRYINIVRSLEKEKADRENHIHDLEEQISSEEGSLNTLKRSHLKERNRLNQVVEDAQQRLETIESELELNKSRQSEKDLRIRELEQALRESVRLTAEHDIFATTREETTRHMEAQIRDLQFNLDQVQRDHRTMNSKLASTQEELKDREAQLKTLENECLQGYIPELEKLRKANFDLNMRIVALLKLIHGSEQMSEIDRQNLLNNSSMLTTYGGLITTATNPIGQTNWIPQQQQSTTTTPGLTRSTPLGLFQHHHQASAISGSTSPHLIGSAFQIIGPGQANTSSFPLGGQLQSRQLNNISDSSILTKILSEKEKLLHQQLKELAKLKFENSELNVQMKSLQRELDQSHTATTTAMKTQQQQVQQQQSDYKMTRFDLTTPTKMINHTGCDYDVNRLEVIHLKATNSELTLRVDQLLRALNDREDRIRILESIQNVDLSNELDKLRKELSSVQSEAISRSSFLTKELDRLKDMNLELSNSQSGLHTQLLEKEERCRLADNERGRISSEYESLHKKYQSVLTQLSTKSEKIQQLEKECYYNQMDEIKRLRLENEEAERRLLYLQKSYNEKEQRFNETERDSTKLRDEVSKLKTRLHSTETDLKNTREEIAYREERLRQIQTQNLEEVNRLRQCNQNEASKASHLKLSLDEKDHQLKISKSEMEKIQTELTAIKKRLKECESQYIIEIKELEDKLEETREIQIEHKQVKEELHRAKVDLEDAMCRIATLQKRIDERELRLRKIESDNHKLLDEIHGLRKSNQEYETEIDHLRQRTIDFDNHLRPASRASPELCVQSADLTSSSETSRIRRQCSELISANAKLQTSLNNSQIQLDQVTLEKDSLRSEMKILREALEKNYEQAISTTTNHEITHQNASLLGQLNEKDLQIQRITEQLERLQTTLKVTASTNQAPLSDVHMTNISDLQAAIRQANNERDQMRNQLASYIAKYDLGEIPVEQNSLQQQYFILDQTNVQLSKEIEIYKHEVEACSTRLSDLTRQLAETQDNFDHVVKQRDQLNDKCAELTQSLNAAKIHRVSTPTSSTGGLITSSSTGHLSRELDRLHREYEDAKIQLQEYETQARTFKAEQEASKLEVKRLKDELKKTKDSQRDLQESVEAREEEMSKLQRSESDKCRKQVQELSEQVCQLQNELSSRDTEIETLEGQAKMQHNRCLNLENEIEDLQKVQHRTELDENERQRHHYETETLMKELEIRENEVNQLKSEVNQLNQVLDELRQIIQELSQKCDMLSVDLERTNQAPIANANMNPEELEESRMRLKHMQEELNDANKARRDAEQQHEEIRQQLEITLRDLDEKNERVQILEMECFQQQAEEIERLRKELNVVSTGSSVGQANINNLKQEIDSLHKELQKRNQTISNMDMNCQENHIKKLEAAQQQIRLYEEEASNLSKVLDEQRRGLEERDRLIRELREHATNNPGGVGGINKDEYDRLMREHAQCNSQLEQRSKQITTLANQLESQTEEILSIKQEALTASLCEKDANMALMELTAPKNDSSTAVLEQMRTERAQIQTQLKQLSNARAAMNEEKKMRNNR